MWDLIVSVLDHCLSFYLFLTIFMSLIEGEGDILFLVRIP